VTGGFDNGYQFSIVPANWLYQRLRSGAARSWADGLWELLILDRAGDQVTPNPITGNEDDALVSGVGPDELRDTLKALKAL
jgi:hypothetical protein